jgi:diguanylate cyclase (GGDEF)-like protein
MEIINLWLKMVKKSSWILLLLIGLLQMQVAASDGQTVARQYNFRLYSAFDGLPQAQVTSVQQDQQGYIWLGSYSGITRYNGRNFETFTDPLPNNYVTSMTKDQSGRIILTTGGGFCFLEVGQFDCRSEKFGLPLTNLFSVYSADNSDVWFAGEGGVMRYANRQYRMYTTDDGLPSPTVRKIIKDRHGKVWAGTRSGLARMKGNRFVQSFPKIFSKALVRAIIDTQQGIWVGSDKGLFLIEHNNDKVIKVGGESLDHQVILSLYKDSNGIIWIGTYDGLFRLIEGKIEKLSPQKGLLSVGVYNIVEDRENNIWLGTDVGLVKYVPGPFVSYTEQQGLSNNFVRTMSIAPDGKIWMGTRYGVSIFSPQTEGFETLTKELQSDRIRIYSILNLDNNSALIGTRAGLIHWKDGRVAGHYSTEDGLESSYVVSIFKDSNNRIWLGTSRGLSRWQNDRVAKVKNSPLSRSAIYTMSEDPQGRIWLGVGNKGLIKFEPESNQFSRLEDIEPANGVSVWSIDVDQQGTIWVGTNGNGLLKISSELKLLEVFDTKNQLKNDFVWQVKKDSKQNVWAYTNAGLKRISSSGISHFDGSDGLPDMEGSATAIVEHPNGDLWFGTGFGVTRFVPSKEIDRTQAPPILLEGAWIGERKLHDNVVLAHDTGTVVVKFSSLTYKDEDNVKYSYRLLGASEQWSEPLDIQQLQLASLSPGSYELQVKSINAASVESDQLVTFSFIIEPPYWQTWWFYTLVALGFLISLYLLIRRRINNLANEKQILETIVSERTAELSEINQELNRLVITDDLTKLYNRRHMMDCLQRELSLLSRNTTETYMSFILLDVDFFKTINDTHGHRAGDEILKQLAKRLRHSCRKTDIAARYGGEEFAVILPFTDQNGAAICAEKIRQDIAKDAFTFDKTSLKMTVSLGLMSVSSAEVGSREFDYDGVIKKADEALYQAKEQGRNCVCIYNSAADIGKPEPFLK